ncbi:MAG: Hsp33 family molecular chaperone HslO [Lachnospiraceae bacterium]|nr:Hsp33 family molecular chaperone HslO [Lachnospiraceae bacterium]MBQ2576319.1 Hsp33 family molecular chaperone HslO [Lachnospiraceae bacterium]MBQ5484647.1 Hsp33 family molecular chaperone HslO [Lachnospiraceae bacterium]
MKDYMIRAIAANDQIRAFAITSRQLTETARMNHNTSPEITAALGRSMSAALMMGMMMDGEKDLLTLQFRGDGPAKGITVTADSHGNVKGFAHNPQVTLPPKEGKLNVGGAIGNGFLTVIRDIGLKEPYVGTVQLMTGEIAEDLTYYFASSEQTPSSVGLGVLMNKENTVRVAGGFIIQLMPDTDDETITKLENNLTGIPPVSTMLEEGNTPEDILKRVLAGFDVKVTEKKDVSFTCDCSRERVERSLATLKDEDLEDIIKDAKPVEVRCQFCNKAYNFTIDEIREMKENRKKEDHD